MSERAFLAETKGFTPVIDALAQEVGFMTAAVYGVAWRFCQMDDGVCRASWERMAEMLGVCRQTIGQHLAKLAECGYLEDTTPGLRNRPHIYRDTGRARIMGLVEARVHPTDNKINTTDNDVNTTDNDVNTTDYKINMKKEPKRELKREPKIGMALSAPAATPTTPDPQPVPVILEKKANVRSDPRSKTPAIQCVYAICDHRYPPKALFDTIIATLGEAPDGQKLRRCRQEWVERGYNGSSWKWLTEWYVTGIPPRNGAKNGGPPGYRRKPQPWDIETDLAVWEADARKIAGEG